MDVTFITHPSYDQHRMHDGHPECPERTQAILAHLKKIGLLDDLKQRKPNGVSEAALKRVHEPAYLERLAESSPASGFATVNPDTHLAPGSPHAARLAAGALEESVSLVLEGDLKRVFCCGRPPGHHAEHDAGMGFCFYNNVAIGASTALAHKDIERVAVLDGAGNEFMCTAAMVDKRATRLIVQQQNRIEPLPYRITLLQAMTKGKSMDFIIQKATELCVHRVVTLAAGRSVAQVGDGASKVEKWRAIAIDSIKQCGSPWLPVIEPPVTPREFLARGESFDLPLIASLQGRTRHPREYISEHETDRKSVV